MSLEVVVSWEQVMKTAKECGNLRKQGKFEEADALQKKNEAFFLRDDVKIQIPDLRRTI